MHRNDNKEDAQSGIWRQDIFATIETAVHALDAQLRELSLDIHDHPELRFEEHHAHDVLTKFMIEHGFDVTKHHMLPTAWLATYKHGQGGRTLGVNSEMDALPGIGHACGHNLIAISGVAVACAAKEVLLRHDIPGTIVLLGTPAEEGGLGKQKLLDGGAYEGMDVCIMCHPNAGPELSSAYGVALSVQEIQVEYSGHSAHAAMSPWEGQNALDAAVLAYSSIAVLRQHLQPTVRVHGIFQGQNWAANIIPDNSKMIWYVRAPTRGQVEEVVKRVLPCFEGPALSTGCKVKVTASEDLVHYDIRQNQALGEAFEEVFRAKFGQVHPTGLGASTDFGNVSYHLPAFHPTFAIPTEHNGGNHTPGFTQAAASQEAHEACLNVSKALALVGIRVILDDVLYEKVQQTFKEDKVHRKTVESPCAKPAATGQY